MMKRGDVELLEGIAEFEGTVDWEQMRMGWSWRHVRVWPATLNRLCLEGYLETMFRSNSYTGYRLTDLGKALAQGGEPGDGPGETQEPLEVPEGLFDDIIGHDDVKELLAAALRAVRPVHVLLSGPPALAKSLFLWDMERVGGERALWLMGSATSKAGLWDLVAERRPRWLLIDELDKMGAADTAALLSLMEGGRLVRTKVGRGLNESVPVWVVAATNNDGRLSPELRSRFAIRRIRPYGREEYRAVVTGVLVRREQVEPQVAEEIARLLDGRSQDVRDSVRVARLSPQVGVARAVELLLG